MSATGHSNSCPLPARSELQFVSPCRHGSSEVSVIPPLVLVTHFTLLDILFRQRTDVKHAILGADFLHHYGLSVDIRKSHLLNTLTQLQVHGLSTQTASAYPSLPCLGSQDQYSTVFAEFLGILCPRTKEQPCQHTVTRHIRTTGPCVSARPRHLPPDCL